MPSPRRYPVGPGVVTRREILRFAGIGLAVVGLPASIKLCAAPGTPLHGPENGSASAERFLFVFLRGGPSHIDLWDPKPEAPSDVRGGFKAIKTRVPGINVTELLPGLARVMDRTTLVRSCSYTPAGLFHHDAAVYEVLSGHQPENCSVSGRLESRSFDDVPTHIARLLPGGQGASNYTLLPGGMDGSGSANGANFTLQSRDARYPLGDFSTNRGSEKYSFRPFKGPAVHERLSDAARRALELSAESEKIRDAYGRNTFGASLLRARRFLEAGSRVVQVDWPTSVKDDSTEMSLDTHKENSDSLRNVGPRLDAGLSTLIEDMDSRGLLSETIVLVMGEFGRSPKPGISTSGNANGLDGRDHWPFCFTALMAGGGITRGAAYGRSDSIGAYPAEKPVHPAQLWASVYHALGIPKDSTFSGQSEPTKRLVDATPILELFG